jgi:hypothetical protein
MYSRLTKAVAVILNTHNQLMNLTDWSTKSLNPSSKKSAKLLHPTERSLKRSNQSKKRSRQLLLVESTDKLVDMEELAVVVEDMEVLSVVTEAPVSVDSVEDQVVMVAVNHHSVVSVDRLVVTEVRVEENIKQNNI